jgi:hypothetical protein
MEDEMNAESDILSRSYAALPIDDAGVTWTQVGSTLVAVEFRWTDGRRYKLSVSEVAESPGEGE